MDPAPKLATSIKLDHDRSPSGSRLRSAWFWAILVLLILTNLRLELRLAHEDAQTNDEAAHLVAGYSYWMLHDGRLNPEHPPLSKLAAALPLLWMGLKLNPDPALWAQADEFALGHEFLYRNTRGADEILFRARCATIAFTAALLLLIALSARRYFGDVPAIFAAALAAFDPAILAHGHYVTSDIPVTLFYFAACVAWFSWLRSGGGRGLLITGILTGLALATKFSALLLFPTFLALWLFHRRSITWRSVLLNLALIPFLIVWATYGLDVRPPASDPRVGAALAATSRLAHVPVPAYYFFRGVHLQLRHAHGGHTAYLLGRLSSRGFLWYFPVALLVKSTLGLLAATVLAFLLILFLRRDELWPLVPAVIYLVISMASPLSIGLRHVLPIYPFLYLLVAAGFASAPLARSANLWRFLFACCVLAAVVESLAAYPFSLGFFNVAVGGPRQGSRYLLDSNLDWGQDLKRLPPFLAEHSIEQPCIAYFGGAEPSYYGISATPLTEVRSTSDLNRADCVAIVSAQLLLGSPTHPFAALEHRAPDAIVGTSLFVYDLRLNPKSLR